MPEHQHDAHNCQIKVCDQKLVMVIRPDGERGLFTAKGVTKGHAILLLELMADYLREELGCPVTR